MIPYGRQDIDQDDVDAVVEVLRSDYLTQGTVVPAFEKAISDYCQASHAIATSNATAALHIACLALGLRKGDSVWTSAITFVASANCALFCGAEVDFVDIDPVSYNMSMDCLEAKLVGAAKTGKLPKIVIPVHMCGQSCEMERLSLLSKKYQFHVIEDASHAIGGKYKGRPVGSCQFSAITVFSFHPVKIITTGEGGIALTNDSALARRMQLFRSHGITAEPAELQPRPNDEIWNYQQHFLGFNYRLTEIQAALGLSQLTKIDRFVSKRHEIAAYYDTEFQGLPLKTPEQHPDSYSSFHLYPVRLNLDEVGITQRECYDYLRANGILVNLHYIPVYRQPYFESLGFLQGYCPESEKYFKEAISLPMFPRLTSDEQNYVVSKLREALS